MSSKMKQKMIYISDELHEALRTEDNASALVGRLLTEHYNFKELKDLSPEEIDKRIQILKTKLEAKRKIEAIQNG